MEQDGFYFVQVSPFLCSEWGCVCALGSRGAWSHGAGRAGKLAPPQPIMPVRDTEPGAWVFWAGKKCSQLRLHVKSPDFQMLQIQFLKKLSSYLNGSHNLPVYELLLLKHRWLASRSFSDNPWSEREGWVCREEPHKPPQGLACPPPHL